MAENMRKVLEVEIIAVLPFLGFTKRMNNHHLIATRIADAILNDDEKISEKIDSLPIIDKHAKKQLKNQLPGFIKKVVDVRNFYSKESHLSQTSGDKKEKYREYAESTHKEFFGINTAGMLPFLIECKKDMKRKVSDNIKI